MNTSCQAFGHTGRHDQGRTPSLDWSCWRSVPEVRNYLYSKGLPSKVPLILDNAPSCPEPTSSSMEVSQWSTCSQTQHLKFRLYTRKAIRTSEAHYTRHSMERTIKATEEVPNRENTVGGGKDCTTEVAVLLQKRLWKPPSPNQFMSRYRVWLHRAYDIANQGKHKRDCGYDKKKRGGWWWKGFKIQMLEKVKS